MTKQALDLGGVGLRILPANAFAGDFAGHFVQIERDGQALLARHATVSLDLFVQCAAGIHVVSANRIREKV